MWKLSCPAKVKICIWRILHGTLPCHVTLINKHMKISPTCPTCSASPEYTKHMLSLYNKAKEGWKKLGMDRIIDKGCEVDDVGEAVLKYLLLLADQKSWIMGHHNVREMIAVSAWYL